MTQRYHNFFTYSVFSLLPLLILVHFAIQHAQMPKAYTNAHMHEEKSSMLGGLLKERSLDSISETKLGDSRTVAENQIVVKGKNVNVSATDLKAKSIALLADENVNIVSDTETRSQTHIHEKKGLSLGLSGGRLTFAEETKDSTTSVSNTNKASNIKADGLLIRSGRDTNLIASNVEAGVMQVDAKRDFNVLSDKDTSYNTKMHSKKEIGIEVTLNSKEASLFAGYWEDKHRKNETTSKVVGSNIQVGALQVKSKNTNVVGSAIVGANIDIDSKNIRVLDATANSAIDDFTKSVKAGVEVGVKQHLSDAANAVSNATKAKSASAVVAGGLQAYDAVQSFAQHPVSAGVNAIYEESTNKNRTTTSQTVASSIVATDSLSLHAKEKLQIRGSDVGSLDTLHVDAGTIDMQAGVSEYTNDASSANKNASVGLYGTHMGQANLSYQTNKQHTVGSAHRNATLFAGKKATIRSHQDTSLKGANIDAKDLTLQVDGDLYVQSLQDTERIKGSSKGGSLSGNVLTGTPTGASVNSGKTEGKKAWVSQMSGINGSEHIKVSVGGKTTLKGASITNMDKNGVDKGNLEFSTAQLVASDIQDSDTYKSTTTGVGVGMQGDKPSLNSVNYSENGKEKAQITKATIGKGKLHIGTQEGSINRDTSDMQHLTKDKSTNTEFYVSDKSLALATDPNAEIDKLKQNLSDVGLAAHVEILENLPSASKGKDGEGDIIDNTIGKVLDAAGDVTKGVIPNAKNDGGYITQIATNVLGDNRGIVQVKDESKMKALHLTKRKPGMKTTEWDYEEITLSDGSKIYRTNPDKKLIIEDGSNQTGNQALEGYKIRISQEDVKRLGLKHIFTNGMNNSADEASENMYEQTGRADGILNYNQTHGVLPDLLGEVALEKLSIMLEDIPGVEQIGYLINGSARQTGNSINQLSKIHYGNIAVSAHSQGTQQTYLGLKQHKEEIHQELATHKESIFTLQNSGSPVSSDAVESLVVDDIYGGTEAIQEHLGDENAKSSDVFRSQVNPGDPIGALGGNFGGVNNHADFFSKDFWKQLPYDFSRGVPTIANGKGGKNPSPHSGYGCVIGCGDDRVTPEFGNYYDPSNPKQQSPLQNYYDQIHVDATKSNVYKPSLPTKDHQ